MEHEIHLPRRLFDILHVAVKAGIGTAEDWQDDDDPEFFAGPLANWQSLAAKFEMTGRFKSPIAVVTVDDGELDVLTMVFEVYCNDAEVCPTREDYEKIENALPA